MSRLLTRHYSTINPASFPKPHLIPKDGTYPKDFVAGGVAAGVKKKAGVLDMAMVYSKRPCTAAAVFTKNAFAAAPVQVDKEILRGRSNAGISAVLVNSGCANACTGNQGLSDAWETSKSTDAALKLPTSSSIPATLVMSTGVIGQPLKMDKILNGIQLLTSPQGMSASHEGWLSAAVGIMTTDTFPKLRSREFKTRTGATYRMAGWCKGAGMIHPNMATMLSAVYTDAPVSTVCLDKALKHSVERSFNAISVDGDTSTNDTLVVLANGAAEGVEPIEDVKSAEYQEFEKNMTDFASELAQLIVRDGEGATKFVDIRVENARSFEEAKEIASTIAKSPLVKTAIYGKDANWGRIICAVGYSGVPIEPTKVNLHFESGDGTTKLHLFKDGAPFDVNEDVAAKILAGEDIVLRVNLGLGKESAQMFTCDFSHEYISINADYRS
ncbi:hypothetical protein HDV05_004518 [Chytridiales sp. JEL 0842]|nr:hypothetical protein HDV05_004518 [Chytridiales sp. JEL 0842]